MNFNDLAEDFLNDYNVNAKKSLDRAERSVAHLKNFFGGDRASNITTDRVKAYHFNLERAKSERENPAEKMEQGAVA